MFSGTNAVIWETFPAVRAYKCSHAELPVPLYLFDEESWACPLFQAGGN